MKNTKSHISRISKPQGYIRGLFCLPLFLLLGCNPFGASPERGAETEIPEEGLSLSFSEWVDQRQDPDPDNWPVLYLDMTTNRIMPCYNYNIFHDVNEYGDSTPIVEITLKEVALPGDICLTAMGPAKARITFSKYSGPVNLVIRDGGLKEEYQLNISREKVEVIGRDADFSEFSDAIYYRRPENSFYFRCGTLTEMSWLCGNFHDLMLEELAVSPFEFPDDGVIPYPEKSSGNWHNDPTRFYRYDDVDEFHRAGELLEDFAREHFSDIQGNSLSITNWLDEAYRSWMLLND